MTEAAPTTPGALEGQELAPKPTAAEARAWRGSRLDELGGNAVGKVEGVYLDEKSGDPEWLHVRMGRFGHHSLVPVRDAVAGVSRIWVPYSRDEIRRAPRIEPGDGLTRDREREFLGHYGIASESSGRGAELTRRGPAEVTSRPAI